MSLQITTDKIVIQNANNVEKFNSSQRLVYQSGYASGSSSLSSSQNFQAISHGLTISDTDIVTVYVELTSATGSVGAGLIGLKVPAQSPIPIDFYARNDANNAAVDSTYMSAYTSREFVHFFSATAPAFNITFGSTYSGSAAGRVAATSHNLSFRWEIFVYKYTS